MEEHIGVPNRMNKRKAIWKLRSGVDIISCEQSLWLSVLDRAILDIGVRNKKNPSIKHTLINSDRYFMNNNFLDMILDYAGVDRGYMFRILRLNEVWPLPVDYYEIS